MTRFFTHSSISSFLPFPLFSIPFLSLPSFAFLPFRLLSSLSFPVLFSLPLSFPYLILFVCFSLLHYLSLPFFSLFYYISSYLLHCFAFLTPPFLSCSSLSCLGFFFLLVDARVSDFLMNDWRTNKQNCHDTSDWTVPITLPQNHTPCTDPLIWSSGVGHA